MSKALPLAQVATGTGRPPCSVTPLSKPMSFIAICPWSWYIDTTASKSPRRAARNTRVRRQRTARVDALATRSLDRGRDDVDLLAPDRAAVARMRIESRDGDARRRVARGLEVAIGDAHGGAHALLRDRVGHVAQRNVRRDARRPQRAGDVELADEARDAEFFLQVAKLVFLRETAEAHRVLVERREHDAVDLAAFRGVRRRLERGQRRAPAGLGRLARRDGPRVDEIERRERRPARLEPERIRARSGAMSTRVPATRSPAASIAGSV